MISDLVIVMSEGAGRETADLAAANGAGAAAASGADSGNTAFAMNVERESCVSSKSFAEQLAQQRLLTAAPTDAVVPYMAGGQAPPPVPASQLQRRPPKGRGGAAGAASTCVKRCSICGLPIKNGKRYCEEHNRAHQTIQRHAVKDSTEEDPTPEHKAKLHCSCALFFCRGVLSCRVSVTRGTSPGQEGWRRVVAVFRPCFSFV